MAVTRYKRPLQHHGRANQRLAQAKTGAEEEDEGACMLRVAEVSGKGVLDEGIG